MEAVALTDLEGGELGYVITATKPGDAVIVQRNTAAEALQLVQARRAAGYVNVEVSHHGARLTDAQLAEIAAKEQPPQRG